MRGLSALALICSCLVACGRDLIEVGDDGSGAGTGGTGAGGTTGTGGQGAGTAVLASPDTGLWRLTRTEYNNTVRDLLGDTTRAGDALPPDYIFGLFDNNAEVLGAAGFAADKYDDVADGLVEKALAAGSATRAKILTCNLAVAGPSCARSSVGAFARRAWRRLVAADELDSLMTALDVAAGVGDGVEEGVKLALRMVLTSPNFLYRVEVDPAPAGGLHPVSPHELATRLSYFVWSSTPDDQLLSLADDGTLRIPEVLATQVGRVLADQKADALIDNFAAQWLSWRAMPDVAKDPKVFPTFDEDLRQAMIGESQLAFRDLLQGERNIGDLLEVSFTFVNARLARHYGLPGVAGSELRRVPLSGDQRFGLLSQGSFLTVTSPIDRTSPTKRGTWILRRLLCTPLPDPPANVPPLPNPTSLSPNATLRQKLEAATQDKVCADCHSLMDPIGFALEHYDGIGAWRDAYPKNTIDATGRLKDGPSFNGAEELSRVVKQDPRFTRCAAETVFTYAFGRDPKSPGDKAAVDALAAAYSQRGGKIRDLVPLIATSQAFQNRGGQR